MEINNALSIVSEFKKQNLKLKIKELRDDLIGKGKNEITELTSIYEAALEVKRISAQIDEMVHASGIIKCLPHILEENETIEDLSLASGADGEGIDVVTNKRLAEFKFSKWQVRKANGMRRRQVFGDLVQLYINPSKKKKEVYVMSYSMVVKFLNGKSKWENVLSKSGGLDKRLKYYLESKKHNFSYVNEIYNVSNVEIIDIEQILKTE